jgi:hypothetical protein
MSRLSIHDWNAKAQPRRWVVMFFAFFFLVGSLLHSELPISGSAQANEPFASSGQDGDTPLMETHMLGRHAPGDKLPGQAHNQFANCAAAGGCGLCGPVQTVDVARPKTLLMPARPTRPAGMSSRTTAPPLRPPIFQA